jgi:DNA-binding response OmpR family regulator
VTAQPSILIVEDDEAIATGLAMNLKLEHYRCSTVHDGAEAAGRILGDRPDLVLLDITLPNRDGLQVLREIRDQGCETPVIVLSARVDEYDKVAALRLGADDYVTKPFALAELMARVQAVLRRVRPAKSEEVLRFGEVEINTAERSVRKAGEDLRLTHLEYELLLYLIQRPNRVVSREDLLQSVWGVRPYGSKRTVDNFVAQLRSKLGEDPESPRHIQTVRGTGYRFVP